MFQNWTCVIFLSSDAKAYCAILQNINFIFPVYPILKLQLIWFDLYWEIAGYLEMHIRSTLPLYFSPTYKRNRQKFLVVSFFKGFFCLSPAPLTVYSTRSGLKTPVMRNVCRVSCLLLSMLTEAQMRALLCPLQAARWRYLNA